MKQCERYYKTMKYLMVGISFVSFTHIPLITPSHSLGMEIIVKYIHRNIFTLTFTVNL